MMLRGIPITLVGIMLIILRKRGLKWPFKIRLSRTLVRLPRFEP